jgi:tRNA U34 5-methylaminomethyl-2-thiouridine-forming methyltransferase MnmC
MVREMIITTDGSHTIAIPGLGVTYHSIHGAIQESKHVFIEAGWNYIVDAFEAQQLNIFEMGFGTGLNAFLTAIEAERRKIRTHYTTVEEFPLAIEEAKLLNYTDYLQNEKLFLQIQESEWSEDVSISDYFTIRKEPVNLVNYATGRQFNLVYYDAFAPSTQPELWTVDVFQKLFGLLKPDGILVTYCSKGDVRRAMIAAGFTVKKLPGPPGKREIIRATRN